MESIQSPTLSSIEKSPYKKLDKIGCGTYGEVYKASRTTPEGGIEYVALKKIKMGTCGDEGFPITTIREIRLLKELAHINVVRLIEIVTETDVRDGIYLVFEYMEHDLEGLIRNQSISKWFTVSQVKCYSKQLLEGLAYCHRNGVMHRDIKTSNLLINNKGILKIADFGMARPYDRERYTNRVVTLWYRAPELLLGATKYGPEVDMWSVGCVVAELLLKRPVFPGRTEIDQLDIIFRVCGTPSKENWTTAECLPNYKAVKSSVQYKRAIGSALPMAPKDAIGFIDALLRLDPKRRMTADEALGCDWFWSDPVPAEPGGLPIYASSHSYTISRKRMGCHQVLCARKNRRLEQQGVNAVPSRVNPCVVR